MSPFETLYFSARVTYVTLMTYSLMFRRFENNKKLLKATNPYILIALWTKPNGVHFLFPWIYLPSYYNWKKNASRWVFWGGIKVRTIITLPDFSSRKFDPLFCIYNHILKVIFELRRPEIKSGLPEFPNPPPKTWPTWPNLTKYWSCQKIRIINLPRVHLTT